MVGKYKYEKYVDIVDNFLESDHYSILIELDEGDRAISLRNILTQYFGHKKLLIRRRQNVIHIEKMVG